MEKGSESFMEKTFEQRADGKRKRRHDVLGRLSGAWAMGRAQFK